MIQGNVMTPPSPSLNNFNYFKVYYDGSVITTDKMVLYSLCNIYKDAHNICWEID